MQQVENKVETVSERVRSERTSREPARDRDAEFENRRRDKRFRVPGSRVRVPCRPFQICGAELDVQDMLFGFMPSFWTSRREMVNLSKGGLAFEARWAVGAGRKVRLQLWVPGRDEPLELCGETRWCKRQDDRSYTVGVQFAPFGSGSDCNPPEALAALRELEAKYA
jgi:hypothetical protein